MRGKERRKGKRRYVKEGRGQERRRLEGNRKKGDRHGACLQRIYPSNINLCYNHHIYMRCLSSKEMGPVSIQVRGVATAVQRIQISLSLLRNGHAILHAAFQRTTEFPRRVSRIRIIETSLLKRLAGAIETWSAESCCSALNVAAESEAVAWVGCLAHQSRSPGMGASPLR